MTSTDAALHGNAPATRTPTVRRLVAMFAMWTLVLTVVAPSSASASATDENSFIAQVNSTRASVGLPALQPDVQLTNLARGWAGSMRDGVCGEGNLICHASPISAGVTHSWAKLGENVGTGPDVGSIMQAFIASPGHYANIVDPEFTHIGVGVVWDGNRMYTTHRFMKLQSTSPTTTTAAPTTTVAPSTTVSPTTSSSTVAPPSTTTPPTVPPTPPPTTPDTNDRDGTGFAQTTSLLQERAVAVLGAIKKISR